MKKLVVLSVALTTVMMLSCGGGNQQSQAEVEEDTTNIEELVPRDHTIYGVCTEGTAMNTLEMITDNGDTLTLSLTSAQERGKVFGGLQVSDRVAVVADKAKKEAQLVINLNTLMGDWVMPDPIDGSAEIGISKRVAWLRASTSRSSSIARGRSSMANWRLNSCVRVVETRKSRIVMRS